MAVFPIIMPHRVLSYLFDHVGISILDEDVQAFWRHAKDVNEPWVQRTPASEHHVPLGLHGDGARLWSVQKFEKMVIISINLPLFRPRSVRHSRFTIFSIGNEKLYKNRTLNRVWMRLAWSLNACFSGVHPTRGPRNQELVGKNLELAGRPITRDHRVFAVTEYRGDWEWHRDVWRPRASWQAIQCCFKCPAVSRGDPHYVYHNSGSMDEPECKWLQEEYTLPGFVSHSLRERQLCSLASPNKLFSNI